MVPAELENTKIFIFVRVSFSACVLGSCWADFGSILGSILVTFGYHFRDLFLDRKLDAQKAGWCVGCGRLAAEAGLYS